ncbi:NAD(P)/FAD-dependent oxidoreductase [Ferruginibacter sp. SUN106]|uniref:NAD(P)/FAD-dependent oxidoreductase n=1 Tax=Ferruginibacter sp. SUN106 TaxID=2978348 RepID=UPI003D35EDC9
MQAEKYGIVGGGIMGMTLALRLAQQGKKVTLFEAAPELGGLASSWKMNDVEWDKFYHVILLSDFGTRGILKEIGLEDKIEWVETKTGFYMNGKLYSMSDTIEFLKFPTLNLIDKFRLGLTILVASRIKNWKKLEKVPVTEWLKKWSGSNTFNKIWLPLLRAKLGESYTKTSAVFIWATIQRLYGARRSGLKKEMFGYVPGGYKVIINAFKQKLIDEGVEIKTSYVASEIKSAASGKAQISFTDGLFEEFDKVISTLPSGLSAKLCVGLSDTETQKLNNINYLGVICVAVLLDKPISNFYVTNITDSWVPFTGVIEMSALVDKKHFGNNNLVYLPKYVSPADPLFNYSDEEIKKFFITNFKKMYPWLTDDNLKFVGVARAKHVITVLTKDYSVNLPAITTSIPNVYIVNTSYILDGTLNVNETIRVAETKLKEITG